MYTDCQESVALWTCHFRRKVLNRSRQSKDSEKLAWAMQCERGALFPCLSGYYKQFAEKVVSLTTLREKKVPWNGLRNAKKPVLIWKKHNVRYLCWPCQLLAMNTDNSNMSIGAVLFQNIDDVESPIVYATHTMSKAGRKYCLTRKRVFRCCLLYQVFWTCFCIERS